MILDRELQRELLTKLSNVYPYAYDFYKDYPKESKIHDKAIANLYYLESHGLVEKGSIFVSKTKPYGGVEPHMQFQAAKISCKGMDFLADDGGLSAILGVVTIKFETEQLKMILETKIMSSDLAPETKKSMIDSLRELPGDVLKQLTAKIVDQGWESIGDLMQKIQSFLS